MWPFRKNLYLVFVVRDPHKYGELIAVCTSKKRAEIIACKRAADGVRTEVEQWETFKDFSSYEYFSSGVTLRCDNNRNLK